MDSKSAGAHLRTLLLNLFSRSELRFFLMAQADTASAVEGISWDQAPGEIAHKVVQWLERRGLVDVALFEALSAERPRRRSEIWAVAAEYGVTLTPSGPAGLVSVGGVDVSVDEVSVGEAPAREAGPPVQLIHTIFRTTGVPDINFVAPAQLPEIEAYLLHLGEGLVVEGASGVGKTTAVRHALSVVLGASLSELDESSRLTWISSKSEQDRNRLANVLREGDRALHGYLVVDDFHRLPPVMQSQVADLIKLVADGTQDRAKIVVIGINPVGTSLVKDFRDLAGRFTVVGLNRQPDEKVDELVRKGEAAANVVFDQREEIVGVARGSFYTAQMLCAEIALLEGVRASVPERRTLHVRPLSRVIDRVRDRLKFKYHDRLVSFASYDEEPPPRGATFALLWLLSRDFEAGVSLARARGRFPALRASLDWLMQSNLAGLFGREPDLAELLFYNREAGVLSVEDPQLDFYLNNLSWPALGRDSGHVVLEWERDGTPVFAGGTLEISTASAVDGIAIPSKLALPLSRVLHLSDLHIERVDAALQLCDQLREDLRGELGIDALSAVVVSGDIVNHGTRDEYQAAAHFFSELKASFSLGPRQIVLVPGNHDLDWGVSKAAYKVLRREDWTGPSDTSWHVEEGRFVEVAALSDLQGRFRAFSDFYYEVCSDPYALDPELQATLHHFPAQRLLFLGLNSSWAIDHLHAARADINARALGRALDRIDREPAFRDSLRIAAWHHPIQSEGDDRIRDTAFLERLAQSGFRLALHGHIHKATPALFRYDLTPGGRRIDLLGAGTAGAPAREMVPGFPLQYQLLELSEEGVTVHTRRREAVNGAWKPDARWTQGKGKDPLPRYRVAL